MPELDADGKLIKKIKDEENDNEDELELELKKELSLADGVL